MNRGIGARSLPPYRRATGGCNLHREVEQTGARLLRHPRLPVHVTAAVTCWQEQVRAGACRLASALHPHRGHAFVRWQGSTDGVITVLKSAAGVSKEPLGDHAVMFAVDFVCMLAGRSPPGSTEHCLATLSHIFLFIPPRFERRGELHVVQSRCAVTFVVHNVTAQ